MDSIDVTTTLNYVYYKEDKLHKQWSLCPLSVNKQGIVLKECWAQSKQLTEEDVETPLG